MVEKIRSSGYHPSSAFPHLSKPTTLTPTPLPFPPLTLFTVLNTLRAETNPVRLAIFGFTEIETGASLPGEDVRLLLTGLAVPRANDRSILQDTPFRTTYHLYIFSHAHMHCLPLVSYKTTRGQGKDRIATRASHVCVEFQLIGQETSRRRRLHTRLKTRSSSLPHFRWQRC